MIDWAVEKYKTASNRKDEQVKIANIIEELDKKRKVNINSEYPILSTILGIFLA